MERLRVAYRKLKARLEGRIYVEGFDIDISEVSDYDWKEHPVETKEGLEEFMRDISEILTDVDFTDDEIARARVIVLMDDMKDMIEKYAPVDIEHLLREIEHLDMHLDERNLVVKRPYARGPIDPDLDPGRTYTRSEEAKRQKRMKEMMASKGKRGCLRCGKMV